MESYIVSKEFGVPDLPIKFSKFPNGEIYLDESYIDKIKRRKDDLVLVWFYKDNESLLELYFLSEYLKENSLMDKFLGLNISYLPYSRMDRVPENKKNMFTLKYISKLINSMEFSSVKLNEVHSDVSLDLINNSYNENITTKMFNKFIFDNIPDKDQLTVMFPDKGAYDRYEDTFNKYKTIYAGKVRNFDTGEITDLDIHGSEEITDNVIIIDDISSRGTTFFKSAEKLSDLGYTNIYLIVAHAENVITDGFIFNPNYTRYINKVITTNTLLDTDRERVKLLINQDRLEVIDFKEIERV